MEIFKILFDWCSVSCTYFTLIIVNYLRVITCRLHLNCTSDKVPGSIPGSNNFLYFLDCISVVDGEMHSAKSTPDISSSSSSSSSSGDLGLGKYDSETLKSRFTDAVTWRSFAEYGSWSTTPKPVRLCARKPMYEHQILAWTGP